METINKPLNDADMISNRPEILEVNNNVQKTAKSCLQYIGMLMLATQHPDVMKDEARLESYMAEARGLEQVLLEMHSPFGELGYGMWMAGVNSKIASHMTHFDEVHQLLLDPPGPLPLLFYTARRIFQTPEDLRFWHKDNTPDDWSNMLVGLIQKNIEEEITALMKNSQAANVEETAKLVMESMGVSETAPESKDRYIPNMILAEVPVFDKETKTVTTPVFIILPDVVSFQQYSDPEEVRITMMAMAMIAQCARKAIQETKAFMDAPMFPTVQ